ncbi:DUF3576 domain-containing protein [Nitrospira sp. Nam74]
MRFLQLAILFSSAIFMVGCASLSKEQHVLCPYDTVWNAAMDTMKDFPVKVKDKESGVIETSWTEMEGPDRRFGVFRRAAFDNKQRSRMIVTVTRRDPGTEVNVTENREQWHVRGGATSQATKWSSVEPSEEAMTAVMNRINSKLKSQGCSTP